MKTSISVNNFLENNQLIEDIFHELKSIVASILSSVELIALYDGKAVEGKITRQTEAIKSQVIELDFQLQNIRIIQNILNKSFVLNARITSLYLFLIQLVREEPYDKLLGAASEIHNNKSGSTDAYVDNYVIRLLILNLYFWMNRYSITHQLPKLFFSFKENYFEIRGSFYANYVFPSSSKTGTERREVATELLNQPVCYLMSYLAALHEGTFDIMVEPEKNMTVIVKIPYKPGGLR